MEGGTKDPGRTTTCMAREYTLGRTAGGTTGSIITIRSKATEFIRGQMEGNSKESGTWENSMAEGGTFWQVGRRKKGSGRTERDYSGQKKPDDELKQYT